LNSVFLSEEIICSQNCFSFQFPKSWARRCPLQIWLHENEKEKNSDRKIINVWQEFVGKKIEKTKAANFWNIWFKEEACFNLPVFHLMLVFWTCRDVFHSNFLSVCLSFYVCIFSSTYPSNFLSVSEHCLLLLNISIFVLIFQIINFFPLVMFRDKREFLFSFFSFFDVSRRCSQTDNPLPGTCLHILRGRCIKKRIGSERREKIIGLSKL